MIAETIPLENVDPTCVYSETADTLNDIFMYRLFDRHLNTTTSQASNSNTHESTSVIVFKCSNKESRLLVDTIRNTTGKTLKNFRRLIKRNFFRFGLAYVIHFQCSIRNTKYH